MRSMTIPDGAARVRLLTDNFGAPNPDDSFRSLAEQVLEDIIVGGFGAIEVQLNPGWDDVQLHQAMENPHVSQKQRDMGHPAGQPRAAVPTRTFLPQAVPTRNLPLVMWPVDGASIRMNLDWDGSPQSQRYLQVNESVGGELGDQTG